MATLKRNGWQLCSGICRSLANSTALHSFGLPVINTFPDLIEDPDWQARKTVNLVTGKINLERFLTALRPRKLNYPSGTSWDNRSNDEFSQASFVSPELPTNENLVEALSYLYSCPEYDEDLMKYRGKRKLRNVFITFLGSSTTGKIPSNQEFRSKVITVNQKTFRNISVPRSVVPDEIDEELSKRLAWVAEHAQGEYELGPDAQDLYEDLISTHNQELEEKLESGETVDYHKVDTALLKVALLIRASRYEEGNYIEKTDIEDAHKLLKATFVTTEEPKETDLELWTRRIRNRIINKPGTTRREILRSWGGTGLNSETLTNAIDHINNEDGLIIKFKSDELKEPSNHGQERYWIE